MLFNLLWRKRKSKWWGYGK